MPKKIKRSVLAIAGSIACGVLLITTLSLISTYDSHSTTTTTMTGRKTYSGRSRSEEARTQRAMREMKFPQWLQRVALKTFEDQAPGALLHTLDAIRTSERVRINVGGIDMWLASLDGRDSAVSQIRSETSNGRDEYGLYRLRQHSGEVTSSGVIVDVGANLGEFSIAASKMYPHLQVVAFEPVPTTFLLLQYNLWINQVHVLTSENDLGFGGVPGVLCVRAAVVGRDSSSFRVSWSAMKSNLAFVDPVASDHLESDAADTSAIVRGVNLEAFLRRRGRLDRHVRMLKIDCEGCEFDAIPSMGDYFADHARIAFVGMEYHLSLLDPTTKTDARKPTKEKKDRLRELLAARGCTNVDGWVLWC